MQRLHNLDKWHVLAEGQGMKFPGSRARNVRLEVNAAQETALYVDDELDNLGQGTGECHFLALVKGRDTIEFTTAGSYTLRAEGGDVSIYTVDGEDISIELEAPVSFTKIVERRKRNPELERVMAVMQQNMRYMEQRLEQATRAREDERRVARSLPAGTGFDGDQSVPRNGETRAESETGATAPGGGIGPAGEQRPGEASGADAGNPELPGGAKKPRKPRVSADEPLSDPTDAG